jgi:predicted nucleic acid-binding protein
MLLDTNIAVDALRRFPPAVAYLRTAEQQGTLSLSLPAQMELIIGCCNAAELRRLRAFLERFEICALSATIGGTAVDLIYQYRLSHGLLLAEALIAATALEYEETLYTKNVRHFRMIPALTVVRPY